MHSQLLIKLVQQRPKGRSITRMFLELDEKIEVEREMAFNLEGGRRTDSNPFRRAQ